MEVKLLRLTTGEDIVAEVTYSDDTITTIKKPFVLIPMAQNPGSSAETKLYFSPFIPFADNEEMNIKESNIIVINEAKPRYTVLTHMLLLGGISEIDVLDKVKNLTNNKAEVELAYDLMAIDVKDNIRTYSIDYAK